MIKLTLKMVAEAAVVDEILRVVQDHLKRGGVRWVEVYQSEGKDR